MGSLLHAKEVLPVNAIDHGLDNSIVAARKQFLEDHLSAVELPRRQKQNLKQKPSLLKQSIGHVRLN